MKPARASISKLLHKINLWCNFQTIARPGFATEFKNISHKCYLAIIMTCLQVSGDSKKLGMSTLHASYSIKLWLQQLWPITYLITKIKKWKKTWYSDHFRPEEQQTWPDFYTLSSHRFLISQSFYFKTCQNDQSCIWNFLFLSYLKIF